VDGYLPVLVGEIVRVGWGLAVYVKWVSREVRTGALRTNYRKAGDYLPRGTELHPRRHEC
jgi:hypothetical protein